MVRRPVEPVIDSRFDGSEASFSSMAARNTEFDPTTGSLARHHQRQGSAPDEKVSIAQKRVSKLEAALRAVGDDNETTPSLHEVLRRACQQAVLLSTQDKVTQCESFLERAREEGGRGQRVGFCKPERVCTIERRGCRRGATVGDTS